MPSFPEAEVPKERARRNIAYIVVGAYVLLLLVNVIVPTTIYLVARPSGSEFQISDLQDLTLAISGAISSLVGVLGFVMGYYFKASETENA